MNNKKFKVGVIGNGFVGESQAFAFSPTSDVRIYDIDPSKATHTKEEIDECDFIFKIPFIPNIIYFIPRGNKSWHSSPDILTKLNRKHLYGYYGKK